MLLSCERKEIPSVKKDNHMDSLANMIDELDQESSENKSIDDKRKILSDKVKERGYSYNNIDLSNPYRKESSIDLEEERDKGWRLIETSVLMSLVSSRLSGSEFSVILYLIHLTRGQSQRLKGKQIKGYYKELTTLDKSKLVKDTGLSRKTVNRCLDSLLQKRMIYEVTEDEYGTVKYGVNFRYDTWVCCSCEMGG